MAFDLHIPEESPRGMSIQMLVAEQHITPEQALERVIDAGLRATPKGKKTPAEELIGAFSSPEDRAILDEAMVSAKAIRAQFDQIRDFGP